MIIVHDLEISETSSQMIIKYCNTAEFFVIMTHASKIPSSRALAKMDGVIFCLTPRRVPSPQRCLCSHRQQAACSTLMLKRRTDSHARR